MTGQTRPKNFAKRRRRRRRKWYPKRTAANWYKYANYAVNGLMLAKKVARLVNVEVKEGTTTNTLTNVDHTTGLVATLNGFAQGDTDSTRDGDSVKMMRVRGKVYWKENGANDSVGRFVIVHDKQATLSAVNQYFGSTGSIIAPLSCKGHDLRFQTKTLYDSGAFSLDAQAGEQNRCFDIDIPLNFHTQYSGGTTTINTGALRLVAISSIATSNIPQIMYYFSVHYVDN